MCYWCTVLPCHTGYTCHLVCVCEPSGDVSMCSTINTTVFKYCNEPEIEHYIVYGLHSPFVLVCICVIS